MDLIEIANRAGLRSAEATFIANRAITFAIGGDYEGMIASTLEVISIAQELGDERLEQRCWFNVCVAYTQLGRIPDAIAAIQRSLAIARRQGGAATLASNYSMASELRTQVQQYDMALVYSDSAVTWGREAGAALPLSQKWRFLPHLKLAQKQKRTPGIYRFDTGCILI